MAQLIFEAGQDGRKYLNKWKEHRKQNTMEGLEVQESNIYIALLGCWVGYKYLENKIVSTHICGEHGT